MSEPTPTLDEISIGERMPDRRVKPCAKCHHPKSRHRTRECRATWQTRGQTFMGISTITKWCTCDGYEPIEEKS